MSVNTKNWQELKKPNTLEIKEGADKKRKAMGIGEPRDVAHMVVYLLSDDSKHVNGTEMVIDNADTVI